MLVGHNLDIWYLRTLAVRRISLAAQGGLLVVAGAQTAEARRIAFFGFCRGIQDEGMGNWRWGVGVGVGVGRE